MAVSTDNAFDNVKWLSILFCLTSNLQLLSPVIPFNVFISLIIHTHNSIEALIETDQIINHNYLITTSLSHLPSQNEIWWGIWSYINWVIATIETKCYKIHSRQEFDLEKILEFRHSFVSAPFWENERINNSLIVLLWAL